MKYLTKQWLRNSQLINLIACYTEDLGEDYDKLFNIAQNKFIKSQRESFSKEVGKTLSDEYLKKVFINTLKYREWVIDGVDKAILCNTDIKRLILGVCKKSTLSAFYELKKNLVKKRDEAREIVKSTSKKAGENLAIYLDVDNFFEQIIYAINFEKERVRLDFGEALLCVEDYTVIQNECNIIYRFESENPYSGLSYLSASELENVNDKFYLHFLITNITGYEERTHHYLTLSGKNIYKVNKNCFKSSVK